MTNKTPSDYFDRVKALQDMLLAVQEDIKQLRADAIEEMGLDDMPKEQAKEIRKDLAEVFAVAKIEAKGELERRNQAAKMARRKRIAEECGVQLDLLDDTDAGAAQRMAQPSGGTKGARGKGLVGKIHDMLIDAGMVHEGGNQYHMPQKAPDPPHNPVTGEVLDDEEPQRAVTSEEPAVMHAGGMSAADYKALGDIPEFLRR
jgi:hypothetical protein